jgi:hypothetical protein
MQADPGLLSTLKEWQDLAAGLLALIAGAFIFLEGKRRARVEREARNEEIENLALWIERECKFIEEQLDSHSMARNDFLSLLNASRRADFPKLRLKTDIIYSVLSLVCTKGMNAECIEALSDLASRLRGVEETNARLEKDMFFRARPLRVIDQPELFPGDAVASSAVSALDEIDTASDSICVTTQRLRSLLHEKYPKPFKVRPHA